jgi:hypothetical protein
MNLAQKTRGGHLLFWCPGCQQLHGGVNVENQDQPLWDWNKSLEKPTIRPSILVTKPNNNTYRCHSFITDGKIQFLSDCSHDLKGKTVDLEDITLHYGGE